MSCERKIVLLPNDSDLHIPNHFVKLDNRQVVAGEKLLFFEYKLFQKISKHKENVFTLVAVEQVTGTDLIFSKCNANADQLFQAPLESFREPLKCCFCQTFFPFEQYKEEGLNDLGELYEIKHGASSPKKCHWIWFLHGYDHGGKVNIRLSCCENTSEVSSITIHPHDGESTSVVNVLVNWKNQWMGAVQEEKKFTILNTLETIYDANYRTLSEYEDFDEQEPYFHEFQSVKTYSKIINNYDYNVLSCYIHQLPNFSLDKSLKAIDFNPGLYCYVKGKSRTVSQEIESDEQWERRNTYRPIDYYCDEYTQYLEKGTRKEPHDLDCNFQSLPSEFIVSENGSVKLASYINGVFLEPSDSGVAEIEKTVEQLIPLMERNGKCTLKGQNIQLIIQSVGNRERGDFEWQCGNFFQEHVEQSAMIFFDDCEVSIREKIDESFIEEFVCLSMDPDSADYQFNSVVRNSVVRGRTTVRKNECLLFNSRNQQVKLLGTKCKGICFLLVNSDIQGRIPSTADVPCQSLASNQERLILQFKELFDRFPIGVRLLIVAYYGLSGLSAEDACQYEKEYYNERREYMKKLGRFMRCRFCPDGF